MPLAADESRRDDYGAPFGNRLLLFVACLYLPAFALWATCAEPGTLLFRGFWTPVALPVLWVADLTRIDRSSDRQFEVGLFTMFCGAMALYWAARGIAHLPRRPRLVLTIGCCLLLAAYSVWQWWALVSIMAAAKA